MARAKTERFWWAVLARAIFQQMLVVQGPSPDMAAWQCANNVEMIARRELVSLGVDLDKNAAVEAEFQRLFANEEKKAKTEAVLWEKAEVLLGLK